MGEADENVVTHLAGQLSAKLDAYEKILSKQAYLAGDEVTLADLFVSEAPYPFQWFCQCLAHCLEGTRRCGGSDQ